MGARGYLIKDEIGECLESAIYKVYHGQGIFLSDKVREKIIERYLNLDNKEKPLDQILSNKESEVLNMLLEQCTDKEISNELKINPSTVRSYVSRMMKKLEVKSRPGLIQYAAKRVLK